MQIWCKMKTKYRELKCILTWMECINVIKVITLSRVQQSFLTASFNKNLDSYHRYSWLRPSVFTHCSWAANARALTYWQRRILAETKWLDIELSRVAKSSLSASLLAKSESPKEIYRCKLNNKTFF